MAWSKSTRIKVMLVLDTVFFFLELGVGIAVQSLALMADAFHMVSLAAQEISTSADPFSVAQRHYIADCRLVGGFRGEQGNHRQIFLWGECYMGCPDLDRV
jgi:hypothetical protein